MGMEASYLHFEIFFVDGMRNVFILNTELVKAFVSQWLDYYTGLIYCVNLIRLVEEKDRARWRDKRNQSDL